jgi:hypothetical protein
LPASLLPIANPGARSPAAGLSAFVGFGGHPPHPGAIGPQFSMRVSAQPSAAEAKVAERQLGVRAEDERRQKVRQIELGL